MKLALSNHLLLGAILLLGAAARFHALGTDARFHPDEAWFATFARSAAVRGDWMLPGPLDKTPLSIYASALSMHFVGAELTGTGVIDVPLRRGEFAARLPNAFTSIVLIALVYELARRLYEDRRVALLAALFMALSPYVVAYSATAFTDGLMLPLMVAALLAVAVDSPGWAGVALALSIAAKQQGILYLPLLVGLAWTQRALTRQWIFRFGMTLVIGVGVILVWDAARPGTSLFALASANNNPERVFANPNELLPRLSTWLEYAGHMLGPPWLTALVAVAGLVTLAGSRYKVDVLLWGYVVGYGLLHWIVAFNTYDRYLLPLVPLVVLLGARGVIDVWRAVSPHAIRSSRFFPLWVGLSLLLLIITAYRAGEQTTDLAGGQQPRGIIALADYLNAKPLGTIVYDRWLGWMLGYYMGAWTDKRRVYYPVPEALAEDALRNPDPAPRYFIAPTDKDVTPWLAALRRAGFAVSPDYNTEEIEVYKLIPHQADPDA